MRLSTLVLLFVATAVARVSGAAPTTLTRKVSSTDRVVVVMEHTATSSRGLREGMTINTATVDSTTFALVDSYDCDNDMVAVVRKFFKANDATFDTCIAECGYQIYPYKGILPDAKAMIGLVNSNACMGIVTAVVLLNMPPCLLENLAMRAACETILHYSVVMRHGVEAPTAEQFNQVMTWRRDVNLARAARKPYDGTSEMYAAFTKHLHKALVLSKVTVLNNYTVIPDQEKADPIEMKDGKQLSFVSTNSAMDYFVGQVVATEDSMNDAPVMVASNLVTTTTAQQSNSVTAAAAPMTLAMTLALAVAFV